MDDLLKNYLTQKYGEGYEQKAKEDLDSAQTQNKWANFASNIGDVIAGNKVGSANQYFQGLNQEAKANTVGKYEKEADNYLKDRMASSQLTDLNEKESQRKIENTEYSPEYEAVVSRLNKMGVEVDREKIKNLKNVKDYIADAKTIGEIQMRSQIDFNNQKALRGMDQKFRKEENELNRQNEIAKANVKASKTGQDALDKDFAKDYNDWTSGGAKLAQSEIKKLKGVIGNLKAGKVTTGGLTGTFPDQLTSDKVLSARSDVQSTVMNSLRALLGPQFTEKEGERIIKNTWNEADSTKNNIARLDRLVNDLTNQALDKDQKSKFYEDKGTLSGYKGFSGVGQNLIVDQNQPGKNKVDQNQPDVDQEVADYANSHGISYEAALDVKAKRTQSAQR